MDLDGIRTLLGPDAASLLAGEPDAPLAPLPPAALAGPDFVDRAWGASPRSPAWLRSFQALFDAGRLAGTGYLALLAESAPPAGAPAAGTPAGGTAAPGHASTPTDAAAPTDSPSPTGAAAPIDAAARAEALATLAQEGGCSALVAGEGTLAMVARRFAHRVPLIARVSADADPAAQARRLRDLGCVGVCVALDDTSGGDSPVAALCRAATDEGLVVLTDAGRARQAVAATIGAALVWRDAGRDRGELGLAMVRDAVRAAWEARLGQLAAANLGDRVGGLRASVVAKRGGALGIVVTANVFSGAEEDVATLHAVQDAWACGGITVV